MMPDSITIYYDYTCPYSYRALKWLQRVRQAGREPAVRWNTFALKEVNRPAGAPSVFEQTAPESISLLALQLAKAAQAAGAEVFERYHAAVFDTMQGLGKKLTAQDLQQIARDAGLDIAAFQAGQQAGIWIQQVARDHEEAVARWKVFGTPTLVFDDQVAVYLKFTEVPPSPTKAAEVLDALLCLARCHPELVEIKYPHAIEPRLA